MQFTKDKFMSVLPKLLARINLLDDAVYELTIKPYKETRSLKANNYSWTLTDKLADTMLVAGVKISKQEMHSEMIFRYGQPMLDDNGQVVMYSSASGINLSDFYPYAKPVGESDLNGKPFTHYKIYRGSHTYTASEFHKFLTGIIAECKEVGIDTDTPEERALLRSLEK